VGEAEDGKRRGVRAVRRTFVRSLANERTGGEGSGVRAAGKPKKPKNAVAAAPTTRDEEIAATGFDTPATIM
jgi:hypothetical protein